VCVFVGREVVVLFCPLFPSSANGYDPTTIGKTHEKHN